MIWIKLYIKYAPERTKFSKLFQDIFESPNRNGNVIKFYQLNLDKCSFTIPPPLHMYP